MDRPLVDPRVLQPLDITNLRDSRKSPGVGRLDPRLGERAMLWLFCRRCAGLFKAPVIVALCPRSISSTEGLIAAADEWDQMASYDEVAR